MRNLRYRYFAWLEGQINEDKEAVQDEYTFQEQLILFFLGNIVAIFVNPLNRVAEWLDKKLTVSKKKVK